MTSQVQVPEPGLIYAAHVAMDGDEQLGQPIAVSNGLPLAKLHHAPFDPDYRVHVGPFLELKGIAGTLIDRPNQIEDRPDRDRLAIRFEQSKRPDSFDQGACGRKTLTAVTKMGHSHGRSHRDAALRQLRSERPELNSRNRRK